MNENLRTPEAQMERLKIALRLAMEQKGMKKWEDLAAFLGYGVPYISQMINGKVQINTPFLVKINAMLGISSAFVRNGEGKPFVWDFEPDSNEASREFLNSTIAAINRMNEKWAIEIGALRAEVESLTSEVHRLSSIVEGGASE